MNDNSPDIAPTAAFAPEQMAQLLFSLKAVMEQHEVCGDFQMEAARFSHLLDASQRSGFAALEQVLLSRRQN